MIHVNRHTRSSDVGKKSEKLKLFLFREGSFLTLFQRSVARVHQLYETAMFYNNQNAHQEYAKSRITSDIYSLREQGWKINDIADHFQKNGLPLYSSSISTILNYTPNPSAQFTSSPVPSACPDLVYGWPHPVYGWLQTDIPDGTDYWSGNVYDATDFDLSRLNPPVSS